jgi:hypothetical protein
MSTPASATTPAATGRTLFWPPWPGDCVDYLAGRGASFDLCFAEGERLRRVYGEHMDIGLGVACGFNPDAAASLRRRLAARPSNCIGISCHYLRIKWPRHLNLFSRRQKQLDKAAREGGAGRPPFLRGLPAYPFNALLMASPRLLALKGLWRMELTPAASAASLS